MKHISLTTLLLLLSTGLLTCVITVVIGQTLWLQALTHSLTPASTPTSAPTPTPTPDPLRPRSILLLGYVGGNHEGGSLTDTIMVAHSNPKTKRITLISIPRDLWVNIPLTATQPREGKINTAYSIGNDTRQYKIRDEKYTGSQPGLALAKDVVSQVTGLPIDFAASISMQGFLNALQTLGPLTVTVPYTFTDDFYPILGKEREPCGFSEADIASLSAALTGFELEKQFPCRYETLQFSKGPTEMDAETALKFVRSRHSGTGGGDFGRTQRQQALLTAVKDTLISPSSWPTIIPTLKSLYTSISTDLSLDDVRALTGLGLNPQDFTVESITLDRSNVLQETRSRDGQYILTAKPEVASPAGNIATSSATSTSYSLTTRPVVSASDSATIISKYITSILSSVAL